MYFAYTLAAALALLISSPWWLLKMLWSGKYRAGLSERLGRFPARLQFQARRGRGIWVHAVSVGEVIAVGLLIAELRQRYPDHRIVISTTTEAGHKLARTRYGPENVFYFPVDLGFAIRPYLKKLRPALVVMAETEFWPNFLHLAKKMGANIAVVNARISNRSFPGYRRWRGLLRRVLANADLFLAQSEEDQRRLLEIGAPPKRVRVSGNLKFDVKPAQQAPILAELKRAIENCAAEPVLVFGSTAAGEEGTLLAAFREILRPYPKALLVLAPRRPERFDEVAALVDVAGLNCVRRSQWQAPHANAPDDRKLKLSGSVLLLDSIGELASVYSLAAVALVGGSLAPRGGHNILEPAQFGIPIVVGPHMENFRDIIGVFRENQAVLEVQEASAEGLAQVLLDLLRDEPKRAAVGAAALRVVQAQQGATARTLEALKPFIGQAL